MMYYRIVIAMLAAAPLLNSGSAHAGGFNVSPVRITLEESAPVAALTLINGPDRARLIQLETVRWIPGPDGEIHEPTRELIGNPPLFRVEPGQRQVVRIGLDRAFPADEGLAYRLFLREVGQDEEAAPQGAMLRILLRIGVPVIVRPREARSEPLQWSARLDEQGALRLEVYNPGNLHRHLRGIMLSTDSGLPLRLDKGSQPGYIYVFPESNHGWTLNPLDPLATRALSIEAQTDRGRQHERIVVD